MRLYRAEQSLAAHTLFRNEVTQAALNVSQISYGSAKLSEIKQDGNQSPNTNRAKKNKVEANSNLSGHRDSDYGTK